MCLRFCIFLIQVSCWQLPPEIAELKKNQENDSLKENVTQLQNSGLLPDKGFVTVSASAPAALTGGRDSVALRTSGTPVSSSALDLIKKKLQDAGTPSTTPSPAVGSGTSDLNGSKAVDAAAKGQQVSNNKDKPRGTDGDGLMSESSSDTDDEESGPTKEECIIQFKVVFFSPLHSSLDVLREVQRYCLYAQLVRCLC